MKKTEDILTSSHARATKNLEEEEEEIEELEAEIAQLKIKPYDDQKRTAGRELYTEQRSVDDIR